MSIRPGSDIGDQVLQGGSLQIAAGESAIVIAGSNQYPALVALAADEGLAGFALRLASELNSCSSPSSEDLRV
jgi:hypothetical protein